MTKQIRHRHYKTQTPEARAEAERIAAIEESEEARDEHRAAFARHRHLRELVGLLKAERERQGLTLEAVAERAGMQVSNLHRLENNRNANPTLDTIQRLAIALGKAIHVELTDEAA